MPGRILSKMVSAYYRLRPLRIRDYYTNNGQRPKGSVLVSYLPAPLTWNADDRRFLGHSHCWEAAEIARVINSLGYSVDVIPWNDTGFKPDKNYVAILDIHKNLTRYGTQETLKVLYVTTSHPGFSNQEAARRIAELESRRGVKLKSRRAFPDEEVELFKHNLVAADRVVLLGNSTTAATFPESIEQKTRFVPVTGSYLKDLRDPLTVRFGNEFLWYGGVGAVHKGLDLTLEVFARHPELVLHVVGPYLREKDFVRAYRRELTTCPNIRSHGFLYPSSTKFSMLTRNVRAFILPSCSESTSTAAVTCMQYGLLPVVSRNCGLDIDQTMGVTLQDCSLEEIEGAVLSLCRAPDSVLRGMTAKAQDLARVRYSRGAFHDGIHKVLAEILP